MIKQFYWIVIKILGAVNKTDALYRNVIRNDLSALSNKMVKDFLKDWLEMPR